MQAIARVRLAPDKPRPAFEWQLRAIRAVLSAVHVIGDVDYELRLACRNLVGLATVLSGLRGCGGVEVVSTALVLGGVPGLGQRGPCGPGLGGTATTATRNVISLSGLGRPNIWPRSARLESDGEISVGGVRLSTLAARYGTPAYIIDEADVRSGCRTYAAAFPGAEIAYATGKALLCRRMAGWIAQEGLSLDVCSAGELAVARSVRLPC